MNGPSSDSTTVANPVAALRQYEQSVWLDFIRRSLIAGGELKRLVDNDGLGGVTSNPAIFEKAIDRSDNYASAIQEISDRHSGVDSQGVYEQLAIKDIHRVRDRKRVATCLGFGPRFLRLTGQGYKGGPGTRVFQQ